MRNSLLYYEGVTTQVDYWWQGGRTDSIIPPTSSSQPNWYFSGKKRPEYFREGRGRCAIHHPPSFSIILYQPLSSFIIL